MKKLSLGLSKIAVVPAALFSLYLFVSAVHYTFNMNLFYYEGISFMTEGPDSRLKNILVLAGALIAFFFICKLVFIGCKGKEERSKRVLILAVILSVIVLTVLSAFVVKTHISVECDQYEVFVRALSFAKGDYSPVEDYYFQMYPQQLGLAFFESLFLHFTEDWLVFQLLNAAFVAASVFMIYRVSHEVFENPYVSFVTLITAFLCFPLYYYVSFVYGDVFMIFASLFIAWALIRLIKASKTRYAVLMILTACVMVPIRKNSLVFLIAAACVLVVSAIAKKKFSPVILAVLILAVPYLVSFGIEKGYEIKAGTKIENGMPSINWIAMGLYPAVNENCSVGVYNMFNELTYFNAGRDTELSKQMAGEFIDSRIEEFKNDKNEAYRFFRFKILEQWAEPTFSSIDSTVGLHKYCWDEVKFSYDFHTLNTMSTIMNFLQSFVYGFAALYLLYAIFKEKELNSLVLIAGFVGGFLFSIIWEASGRYVFPYFLLLLPLAGGACGSVIDRFETELEKVKKADREGPVKEKKRRYFKGEDE